jgi:hypothetical protein
MRSMLTWPLLTLTFAVCYCAFSTPKADAQVSGGDLRTAVSSDAFLKGITATSLEQNTGVLDFPVIAKDGRKIEPANSAIPVGYTSGYQETQSQPVTTAQFESPVTADAIGTGVSNQIQPMTVATPVSQTPDGQTSQSWTNEATRLNLRDRPGLARDQPNFLVGYELLGFHRSNDSVGPYSKGQGLDRFDQDTSARYTFSRLLGGIERIDFKFTGPFHWEKQSTVNGPVDSNFPSSINAAFDQADKHRLSHQIRLASYELNRCWSSDELSTFFYGLRVFDHSEKYLLDASKGAGNGVFQLAANNFLAGGQIGLNLSRPLSQRWTVGFDGGLGLYGNFANGSLDANNGPSTLLDSSDNRFRLTSVITTGGSVNYRVSQNIVATGAYEYWYFPGLATAADQPLSNNAQLASLALRTGDDQLFRGWSLGLSARF